MTPKKIALLTDSSADLRWDQARENNIFLSRCGSCARTANIWTASTSPARIFISGFITASCPRPPCPVWRTSARSSGRSFDLGYDGVIAVMLSSGLSGTYNLARILAGECAEQGYAMKVFDSVSGALGQGHDGAAAG